MTYLRIEINLTEPKRADQALAEALKKRFGAYPNRTVKLLFHRNRVWLNSRAVKPSSVIGTTTLLISNWDHFDEHPFTPKSDDLGIPTLYEDERFIGLCKPNGVPVLPLSSRESSTLVNQAVYSFPELLQEYPKLLEVGLVYRLDNDTSGLCLFCKKRDLLFDLRKRWSADRSIIKTYLAITSSAEPTPGDIDDPIDHDPKSKKRMIINPKHGKPALTRIIESKVLGNSITLSTIELQKGIRHQIRVHLASKGHPILGDTLYKGVASQRLHLHCYSIEIPFPDGSRFKIKCEPDPSFFPSNQ